MEGLISIKLISKDMIRGRPSVHSKGEIFRAFPLLLTHSKTKYEYLTNSHIITNWESSFGSYEPYKKLTNS